MHEKLGDEGRRALSESACSATQNVLRLLGDNNKYQENDDYKKNSSCLVNKENNEITKFSKEKLTISRNSENSDSITRNHAGNGAIKADDENGTRFSRNKQWTNKVDGIAILPSKGNVENEETEAYQPIESNVRAFFSNLLKFSLKRFYGQCPDNVVVEDKTEEGKVEDEDLNVIENLNEEIMGNLQTGESRRSREANKSLTKKKGIFLVKKTTGGKDGRVQTTTEKPEDESKTSRHSNKLEKVSEEFLNVCAAGEEKKVVLPEGIVGAKDPTVTGPNGNVNSVEPDPAQYTAMNMISDAKCISTDSWRQVRNFDKEKELPVINFETLSAQSRDSSLESVFMNPLTPRDLSIKFDTTKTHKAGESGSSSASKTSTLSLRQDTEFDGTSSLEDVTLIEDQMTDAEVEDSITARRKVNMRSASMDASEGGASTTSAPCPSRPNPFTIQKYRMVDLEPLTSATALMSTSQDQLRKLSSSSEMTLESNVLRKVASLTLDKNTIEQKVHRPKFVPEKLDFQIYEKFEGQQLVNWYISSFPEDHYLKMLLAPQDFKILIAQFCTHMLAAGVLRQIPDKNAPVASLFRPDLMYYWARSEPPAVTPSTPRRLSSGTWSLFSSTEVPATTPQTRPGARHIEPESSEDKENVMTASTGSVDKAIRKIETEEFQQLVMGLKKEHKENITKLTRGQEVKLFKLRGEHAHVLHEYEKRILELEEVVKKLTQEVEKQKILMDIQSLTSQPILDSNASENDQIPPSATKENGIPAVPTTGLPVNGRINTLLEKRQSNGFFTKPSPDSPLESTKLSSSSLIVKREEISKKDEETHRVSSELVSNSRKETVFESDLIEIKAKLEAENEGETERERGSNASKVPKLNSPSEFKAVIKESSSTNTAEDKVVPTASIVPDYSAVQELSLPLNDENKTSRPMEPAPNLVQPPPPPPPPPPPLPFLSTPSDVGINGTAPISSTSLRSPPSIALAKTFPQPPPPPPPPPLPNLCSSKPNLFPTVLSPCNDEQLHSSPNTCEAIPPPPPMVDSMGIPPPAPPLCGMPPFPPPPPPPPPPASNPNRSALPPPVNGGNTTPMPLPTPPVGGWNAQRAVVSHGNVSLVPELRKKPVNPAVPMKPLYWSRIIVPVNQPVKELNPIGNETSSLLWEKLEEAKIEDYSEFNELFSRQIITRKHTRKKAQEISKQQAAKILDSKRSQNVGILSSSLHVDFNEIESAIYHFDTSVVNLEALQQIYEMRATEEELAQIKAHVKCNPEIPLDKPEQFLLELSEIPNFAERIACFMFQSEFEENINTVESKLNNLKATCEMLLKSESVKTVMAIILALGNYMNGGNMTRGQADGFGIEILPKLKDVKSKDSSVTLLHFIVRTYMKKLEDPLNPDLALPVPEPGDISRASIVNFDEIKNDLQNLKKELKTCQVQTQKVINASNEDNLQPFKDKMEAFLLAAQKQILGEFENLEECKVKFRATMNFYQYKSKTEDEVKEFFTIWGPFSKDFKDIWKKEQQKLIKEKMQEFKKKQDVRKQEIKPVKAGGLKDKMKQRLSLGKRS